MVAELAMGLGDFTSVATCASQTDRLAALGRAPEDAAVVLELDQGWLATRKEATIFGY